RAGDSEPVRVNLRQAANVIERPDTVPCLQRQHEWIIVRGLLRILPADHAIRKHRRAKPGELRATNLLFRTHPAQRFEMSMRTKYARAGFLLLERSIQISRTEKARHCFQSDIP